MLLMLLYIAFVYFGFVFGYHLLVVQICFVSAAA